jgi:hypothetical protein
MLSKNRLPLILLVAAIMASAIMLNHASAQIPTPVPTFTPMPTTTPHPMATLRLFHCSCAGPGFPLSWSGTVQAPNYFQASQQASGQCNGYVNKLPVSPQIQLHSAPIFPTPLALMLSQCTSCACN